MDGVARYLQGGPAGYWSMVNTAGDLVWAVVPPGEKDDAIDTTQWTELFLLDTSGNGTFAGTLVVDGVMIGGPGGSNAASQAWVTANTANSFNGRQGVVTLTTADVTGAGGAPIALEPPAVRSSGFGPTAARATGAAASRPAPRPRAAGRAPGPSARDIAAGRAGT